MLSSLAQHVLNAFKYSFSYEVQVQFQAICMVVSTSLSSIKTQFGVKIDSKKVFQKISLQTLSLFKVTKATNLGGKSLYGSTHSQENFPFWTYIYVVELIARLVSLSQFKKFNFWRECYYFYVFKFIGYYYISGSICPPFVSI